MPVRWLVKKEMRNLQGTKDQHLMIFSKQKMILKVMQAEMIPSSLELQLVKKEI